MQVQNSIGHLQLRYKINEKYVGVFQSALCTYLRAVKLQPTYDHNKGLSRHVKSIGSLPFPSSAEPALVVSQPSTDPAELLIQQDQAIPCYFPLTKCPIAHKSQVSCICVQKPICCASWKCWTLLHRQNCQGRLGIIDTCAHPQGTVWFH